MSGGHSSLAEGALAERRDQVVAHGRGRATDELLARMLASRVEGQGVLPPGLGLTPARFARLLERELPGLVWAVPRPEEAALDAERHQEREELVQLLLDHRAGLDPLEADMAEVVAAACMGGNHLWQDLGLWSRKDLSQLLGLCFPALVAANDRDMKWKKFFYKQLCQREGIHVCRSPSCEQCPDYADCFGPED